MPHSALFTPDELDTIGTLAINTGLAVGCRPLLMASFPPGMWQAIPTGRSPVEQLRLDLDSLNAHPPLVPNDDPPLALWLDRAAAQLDHRTEREQLRAYATEARVRGALLGVDPIAVWRDHLLGHYGAPVAFSSASGGALLAIENVVPLTIGAPGARAARPDDERTERLSLRRLLEQPPPRDRPVRWVVLGQPGAGKSTLARHLAWSLACGGVEAPIPVLYSLTRLAESNRHPFELAEDELRNARGPLAKGLRRALEVAAARGAVWLLLDGYDEVAGDRLEGVVDTLLAWHVALPAARVAVFSRPTGWRSHRLEHAFARAQVRPLTGFQQRALLNAWLGPDAARSVLHRVARQPALTELARNPLMLTLLAMLSRAGTALPPSRSALYDTALGLLLERGHGDRPSAGVRAPTVARRLLADLSLMLTNNGAEAWHRAELVDAVLGLDAELGARREQVWGPDPEAFLADIAQHSGIIGPHDGPGERWRYLHRSLRERLAAEALASQGTDAVVVRIETLAAHMDHIAQWGETPGMACNLCDAPLRALDAIRALSEPLALHLLADTPTVPAADALAFVTALDPGLPDWQGDQLYSGDRLVELLRERPGAIEALWAVVDPRLDLDSLAWVHAALSTLGGLVDRQRFFTACARWPADGPPAPALLQIQPSIFRAGSPLDEVGRYDNEAPPHRVRLTAPYAIASTPVTIAEYRRFDADHACRGAEREPVTEVSWWRARLYAAWLGCTLPTEAQWAYAARAGAESRFWSGDSDVDLERVGWMLMTCRGVRPVGERPANGFGLYDVHGNVLEWCRDRYRGRLAAPSLDVVIRDPIGPPRGTLRVLRGGGFDAPAADCRLARRQGRGPSHCDLRTGFRLARELGPPK